FGADDGLARRFDAAHVAALDRHDLRRGRLQQRSGGDKQQDLHVHILATAGPSRRAAHPKRAHVILDSMSPTASAAAATKLDIAAIQAALAADGLDAWLLYDFHGLNPIALDVTGVGHQGGHLATRRWYYLIPAKGEPRGLVHAIERQTLAHLPG